MSVALLPKIR